MRYKPVRRKGTRVHRLFTSTLRFMVWLARPLIWISSAIVRVQMTLGLVDVVGSAVGTAVSWIRALPLHRPRLPRLWGYKKVSLSKDSAEGRPHEKKRSLPKPTPLSVCVPESKPSSALFQERKPPSLRVPEREPPFVHARVKQHTSRFVHIPKPKPPSGSDMGGCCWSSGGQSVVEEESMKYNHQRIGHQRGLSSSDAEGGNARGAEGQDFRKDSHKSPIYGSDESPKGYGKDACEQHQHTKLQGEVDRLKNEVRQLQQEKEVFVKHEDARLSSHKDKLAEIQNLESQNNELKQEVEKRDNENASLRQKLSEIAIKYDKFEKENEHLKNQVRQLSLFLKETESRCVTAESELRTCQKQLEDMTCRFSKAVSDNLRLGNPALEDLSTANRPLRLADRYQVELYGEVWCDALGELMDAGMEEESALLRLFHTVTDVYKFCLSYRDHLLTSDLNDLFFPRRNTERDVTSCCSSVPGSLTGKPDRMTEQTVLDLLRKAFSPQTVASLKQVYAEALQKSDPQMLPMENNMKAFTALSLELCWLFLIQDPPMVLHFQLPQDKVVDDKLYQCYNKVGTHARCVVWPALLLHSGGNVLFKGKVLAGPPDEQSTPSAPNLQSNNH